MKKLITILIVLTTLTPIILFAGSEAASVEINYEVTENILNSGIRIVDGDAKTTIGSSSQLFSQAFDQATNYIDLAWTDWDKEDDVYVDRTGLFSVLVRRGSNTPIDVSVSGSPLQMGETEAYLGYKLEIVNGATIYDSTSNPATEYSESASYQAKSTLATSAIKDVQLFKYTIPYDHSALYGEYNTSITLE